MLAGTFNAYGGLSPGLHADYVAPWASAFKENVRRLITEESPNMIPLKRKMFLDSVNFLFKDVFGMRARRRLMYLRNSQVTPDLNSPAPNIGQNVPAAIQLFANHYSAWCRAGKLNGVHYQVLQFKASHQMYEDFQVLCRDHNGAIKAFLSSRGLTPTSGRKHHDLVIEYLVEELGVEVSPYQFQQTVRDMECVSSLVRSFGHGVLALLPQETISWYDTLSMVMILSNCL